MEFLSSNSGFKPRLKPGYLKLSFAFCLGLIWGASFAQQPNPDAITLFARNPVSGTARSGGLGGAFGSVGADLSSLDINPAGLGLYRSSDFCLTPGLVISSNMASYDGTNTKSRIVIDGSMAQVGFAVTKVFANANGNEGMHFESHPLRSITFAVNFQTNSYFGRSQSFNNTNNTNSLVDNYVFYSNHYRTDQWSVASAMFSGANIMGYNSTNNSFYSNVKLPVQQAGSIESQGAVYKISLGLGANISDKLYFGFGVGVPLLRYTVNAQMTEATPDLSVLVSQFQNYQLMNTTGDNGVGVTGNLGLIYRPVTWARFGLAYHLPTWYFLTETNTTSLNFNFDSLQASYSPYELPPITYRLRMPMKGVASASFYLKDHGFISIDYEMQNIGSTRYNFRDSTIPANYDTLYNNYIKRTYNFNHTVRIGIEGSIKVFRLRAGYSFSSTPFKKGQNYAPGYGQAIHNASIGVGVRLKHFYADLAYAFTYSKDAVSPNFQTPFDEIDSKYMRHTLLLTFGWKISSEPKDRKKATPANNYTPPPVDPAERY